MAGSPGPLAGRANRDKVALAVCIPIGIGVTEAVGEAVRPALDFWPAFAVKVAAGWAAVMVAWVMWVRLIRPRS